MIRWGLSPPSGPLASLRSVTVPFLIQLILSMALIIGFVAVWMIATATAGTLVGWAARRFKGRAE